MSCHVLSLTALYECDMLYSPQDLSFIRSVPLACAGDPLQIISDGTLKSNFHRVRMPKSEESQGGVSFECIQAHVHGPYGPYHGWPKHARCASGA